MMAKLLKSKSSFKNKKLIIFLKNHKSIKGVSDYINYFYYLSKKYQFNLIIKNKIPKINSDPIIVIEEFSNNKFANEIIKNFRNYKSKRILIVTEFPDYKKEIFNSFIIQKKKFKEFKYKAKIYPIINFLLSLISTIRKIRLNTGMGKKLKKILFKISKLLKSNLVKINSEWYEFVYFKTRYKNFLRVIESFDIFLTSHQNIELKNLYFGKKIRFIILFSNFNLNFLNTKDFKNIKFTFSGLLNEYRFNKLRQIKKKFQSKNFVNLKYINNIIKTKKRRFISSSKNNDNIFSIHVEKSVDWPHSSPTRYINSFAKNEIPVVIKKFEDVYTQNLTMHIDDFNTSLPETKKNIRKFIKRSVNFKKKLVKNELQILNILFK